MRHFEIGFSTAASPPAAGRRAAPSGTDAGLLIRRRSFLGLAGAALVCGCAPINVVTTTVGPMYIQSINVDRWDTFERVESREVEISAAQVTRELDALLKERFLGQGFRNAVPVDVTVTLTNVVLPTRNQAVFLGNVSSLGAVLTVVDARTGEERATGNAVARALDERGRPTARTNPPLEEYEQLKVNFVRGLEGTLNELGLDPSFARVGRGLSPSTGGRHPGVNVPPGGWNSLREPYWQL